MRLVASGILFLFLAGTVGGESVDDLLKQATAAVKDGKVKKALELVDRAVTADARDTRPLLMRASIYNALDRLSDARADLDRVIKLAPKNADAFQQRGVINFKLARFDDSVADFDRFLALRPDRKPHHWQRGISCYYARKYEEGQKQFEGYQNVDSNDVENVVWRYMCMAKRIGVAKARKDILKVEKDRRVPMMEIFDMFRGKLQPEDVLKAARAGKSPPLREHLFYAHLYIGFFYDSEDNPKKALEHLDIATEKYRIGHYMWDVGRVHRDLLKKTVKAPAGKEKAGWKRLFDGKTLAGWKSANFGGEGEVQVKDGAVILDQGNDMTGITYTRGDFPRKDYEVLLEAKKIRGNDFFCTTTFPVGDSYCSLVVGGWGGNVVGLSSIDGQDASENETNSIKNFKNDQWYRVRIRVAGGKITAWIDDKKVVDLAATNRKISIRPECNLCRPFGIATWRTTGAIRDIAVRSGKLVDRE